MTEKYNGGGGNNFLTYNDLNSNFGNIVIDITDYIDGAPDSFTIYDYDITNKLLTDSNCMNILIKSYNMISRPSEVIFYQDEFICKYKFTIHIMSDGDKEQDREIIITSMTWADKNYQDSQSNKIYIEIR